MAKKELVEQNKVNSPDLIPRKTTNPDIVK